MFAGCVDCCTGWGLTFREFQMRVEVIFCVTSVVLSALGCADRFLSEPHPPQQFSTDSTRLQETTPNAMQQPFNPALEVPVETMR